MFFMGLDAHGRLERGYQFHFRMPDLDPFDAHGSLLIERCLNVQEKNTILDSGKKYREMSFPPEDGRSRSGSG
jgi:hypothetical protein